MLKALRAGRAVAKMSKFYYSYVLKSLNDNNLYIGWTNDLRSRVIKHNKGLVQATKARRPLKLIYYEACLNKQSAIDREKSLKTGFGRKYLKNRCRVGSSTVEQ